MFKTKFISLYSFLFCAIIFSGCKTVTGNVGQMQVYSYVTTEAEWIRKGEPIPFEGELWYPMDGSESLLDSEVFLLGEYRGVQFFADKLDVRPYSRLYTKLGRNQFRYYEKK